MGFTTALYKVVDFKYLYNNGIVEKVRFMKLRIYDFFQHIQNIKWCQERHHFYCKEGKKLKAKSNNGLCWETNFSRI